MGVPSYKTPKPTEHDFHGKHSLSVPEDMVPIGHCVHDVSDVLVPTSDISNPGPHFEWPTQLVAGLSS